MQLLSKFFRGPPIVHGNICRRLQTFGTGNFSVISQKSPKRLFILKHPKSDGMIPAQHCRIFSTAFKTTPFASPKSLLGFHLRDGMDPKKFTLVYKSDFQWYLVLCQLFVLLSVGAGTTSIVAACVEKYAQMFMTPEEIEEAKMAKKKEAMDTDRGSIQTNPTPATLEKLTEEELTDPNIVLNRPSLSDIVGEDIEVLSLLTILLVSINLCLYKFMKVLPMRIYVGKKGYSVGVYYGSLIPGRLTQEEFVAGTIKMQKSKLNRDVVFKTPSGSVMVLFDHFFRKPSDFDYLIGLTKTFDDNDEQEDEISQMKQAASGAAPGQK